MHTPVLLQDVVSALAVKEGSLVIDATAGEGGHIGEFLRLGANLLAIDWDPRQIEKLKSIFGTKAKLAQGNFADIETIAARESFKPVDAVLFDLGLSMEQLFRSGRGFSYRYQDDPLDMRIDPQGETTASEILNSFDVSELYWIFAHYSEDIHSQLLAEAIARQRKFNKFRDVSDLMQVINKVLADCPSGHYHNANDTAGRIFQALRIQVNDEMENLKKGLTGAINIIKEQGRVAVISFHSVEDRLVKQFVRDQKLVSIVKVSARKSPHSFEKPAKLRVFAKKL